MEQKSFSQSNVRKETFRHFFEIGPKPLAIRLFKATSFALCFFYFAVPTQAAAFAQETGIDSEIVLRIGKAEISRYAAEKNIFRLHRSVRNNAVSLSGEANNQFELYLSRLVMIAEALDLGYDKRAEVIRVVESMEQHMLAQLVVLPAPPSELEVRAVFDRTPVPADHKKPNFLEVRTILQQAMIQQQRQELARAMRERALKGVDLTILPEVAQQLVQLIRSELKTANDIPETLVVNLSAVPLATCRREGENVTITVEAWRQYFNGLFVRSLPDDTEQLHKSVEELVVAEYAAREARLRGIDREPKFVEDRRNFLYYQALDLFEKERLQPLIIISPAEAENYYNEHLSEFSRPVRAKGKIMHFPDSSTASAWLRAGKPGGVIGAEEIEVSQACPIVGAENATDHILHMRKDGSFGPIASKSGVVVFVKEATENEQLPYSAAKVEIQTKAMRPKLEALELKLAREWSPRYSVDDRLSAEQFGVVGTVQKPWVQSIK